MFSEKESCPGNKGQSKEFQAMQADACSVSGLADSSPQSRVTPLVSEMRPTLEDVAKSVQKEGSGNEDIFAGSGEVAHMTEQQSELHDGTGKPCLELSTSPK